MNLWDLGHSVLTGSWRLQREAIRDERHYIEQTREKRSMMVSNHLARMQLYAGAEPGINRPYPNTLSTPEDYRQAYQRIVLIRAARQMEEDYGFFDGILDDFETYVVGDELVYMPNTGNIEADRVIRRYLEWQFDQIDYKGQYDLTKMAHLLVRGMKRDGECGVAPVDVGDGVKLRSYSGDLIGNPMVAVNAATNDYNGIVVDPQTEQIERFDLYYRAPKLNAYYFDRSLPAGGFWHYFDPFRLHQYHGVSVFKNAIRDAFDVDQILEYTKLNIKWRASQLPTVHTETGRPKGGLNGYFGWGTTNPGSPNPNGGPVANGVPQPSQINVQGVTTQYLKLDESVMEYPNDFPNAQMRVAVEEFRRQCCKGAKLPYEFVFRADNGGVVQRFWVDKAKNTFLRDRYWLRRQVLNPTKNRVIQKGIDTGELDLTPFGNLFADEARFRGAWQMGKAVSVDYGRETDADVKLIENGLMSPQEKAADMGRGDVEEIADEIDAFVNMMFDRAIAASVRLKQPLEMVLPFYLKKFPNQPKGSVPPADLLVPGSPGAPVPAGDPSDQTVDA